MADEIQQEVRQLLNRLFVQDDVVHYFAVMNPEDDDGNPAPIPAGLMTTEQQKAHKKFKAAVAALLLEVDFWDRDEAFKEAFTRMLDQRITQRMKR